MLAEIQFYQIESCIRDTVYNFLEIIFSIINHSRESAKRESRLFCDRPMIATDTMNFWVGYIIRNGARALRSPAVDLYWWQVELLDVYGFLLLCFIAICLLIVLCVRYVVRALWKTFRRNHDFSKKKD